MSLLFSRASGAGMSIVRFGLGGADAFANRDGSLVVQVINSSATPQQVRLAVAGGARLRDAAAYLTDAAHSLAPQAPPTPAGSAELPAGSLSTWVIPRH